MISPSIAAPFPAPASRNTEHRHRLVTAWRATNDGNTEIPNTGTDWKL
jgi:hypothetical protein